MSEYDSIKCYSDVVHFEEEHNFSKDQLTVADTFTAELGEVLGKITASGKYTPLDQDAADGSEVAAAVAVTEKTDESGDGLIYAITRHAVVRAENLVWPDDIDAGEKTTAIAQLKAAGILVR